MAQESSFDDGGKLALDNACSLSPKYKKLFGVKTGDTEYLRFLRRQQKDTFAGPSYSADTRWINQGESGISSLPPSSGITLHANDIGDGLNLRYFFNHYGEIIPIELTRVTANKKAVREKLPGNQIASRDVRAYRISDGEYRSMLPTEVVTAKCDVHMCYTHQPSDQSIIMSIKEK